MKTKLFIAFLLISNITFAQKTIQTKANNQNTKQVNPYVKIDDFDGQSADKNSARFYQKRKYAEELLEKKSKKRGYVKFEGVTGESNDKSSKRSTGFIKLMDVKGESNNKQSIKVVAPYNSSTDSSAFFAKFEGVDGESEKNTSNRRQRGDVIMEDLKISNQNNTTRRRVVVAKSNKQGDLDKN